MKKLLLLIIMSAFLLSACSLDVLNFKLGGSEGTSGEETAEKVATDEEEFKIRMAQYKVAIEGNLVGYYGGIFYPESPAYVENQEKIALALKTIEAGEIPVDPAGDQITITRENFTLGTVDGDLGFAVVLEKIVDSGLTEAIEGPYAYVFKKDGDIWKLFERKAVTAEIDRNTYLTPYK